nr:hypothetical protein Iba_chr09bCG12310 [Ipomoea batatas]
MTSSSASLATNTHSVSSPALSVHSPHEPPSQGPLPSASPTVPPSPCSSPGAAHTDTSGSQSSTASSSSTHTIPSHESQDCSRPVRIRRPNPKYIRAERVREEWAQIDTILDKHFLVHEQEVKAGTGAIYKSKREREEWAHIDAILHMHFLVHEQEVEAGAKAVEHYCLLAILCHLSFQYVLLQQHLVYHLGSGVVYNYKRPQPLPNIL